MKILLAQPRGFCAGVTRAIETVEQALERFGAPVYVLHEIVHNRHVLARLRERGAVFVRELAHIPRGEICIFSAHGVSCATVEQARKQGLRTIDATCPLVARIHRRVRRLDAEGVEIIIIGHAGHPEVEGTRGRVRGQVRVVSTLEEIEALESARSDRVAFATQTTLSQDESSHLIEALRRRFPAIQGPAGTDICYATQNRQNAVRRLAEQCPLVLVVGSKNSSNSNRLREVAGEAGAEARLIDDASDLRQEWFDQVEQVGITAGASAPEDLVQGVVAALEERYAAVVEEMEGKKENIRFAPAAMPGEDRARQE